MLGFSPLSQGPIGTSGAASKCNCNHRCSKRSSYGTNTI